MLPSAEAALLGNSDPIRTHLVEVVLNSLYLRVVRRDPEPHQAKRCWQSVDYINGDVAPQLCLFLAAVQMHACSVVSFKRSRLNAGAPKAVGYNIVAEFLLYEPPDDAE